MLLSNYYTEKARAVSFTEDLASAFAKGVAGDFNPIHDPQSKRFCVPGDLLFSVLLDRYGIAQTTGVQFSGMLDGKTAMLLPEKATDHTHLVDENDKPLLSLFLQGPRIVNAHFINCLTEQYVRFSGKTFPDILVPLMRKAGVMINPDRPLVIYKDMSIELSSSGLNLFDHNQRASGEELTHLKGPLGSLALELTETDISVNGRKGAVRLQFAIAINGVEVGEGEKNMVLSGLREFDEAAMAGIVETYNKWRTNYQTEVDAV